MAGESFSELELQDSEIELQEPRGASEQDSELQDELSDLEHVKNWADGAVLWSTDWTAETVISQLNRGNIDLDPNFQRRSAWTDKKQSLFIESAILGLPIPQLILAEDRNRKGSFIVIDGKQRLLAIRRFASTKSESKFRPLKLRGLGERAELNGKSYVDLLESEDCSEDLAAFQNSSIRTVVIRNWKSEAYLYEVFLRINTGSVQLSPQELRQALHPGPFSSYVDVASSDSPGLRAALGLKAPDFRMRDAEILLRYLAYKNFHSMFAGNLKVFLDNTTKELNETWAEKEKLVKSQIEEMDNAFEFTRNAFGEKAYLRKWNGDEFERRKNRAVFDIMLHFFSVPEYRRATANRANELRDRFIDLCQNDAEFLASIERTTKTVEANEIRFNRWAEVIQSVGDIEVQRVDFDN
ncbi:DUF262 domain-containing protein [Rhodovibrionaceae bacterium A322]